MSLSPSFYLPINVSLSLYLYLSSFSASDRKSRFPPHPIQRRRRIEEGACFFYAWCSPWTQIGKDNATVFGVSTESMQLTYDSRGNIVPTILLMMQSHLYSRGGLRVEGIFRINVSRAFGDRLLKQYVVADPEIQEEKIDDSLEFLILASDGLWDVFSNEEAVAMVKEVEDPEDSAKKLVGEAIKKGSADNITCVVVRFLEKASSSQSSKEANQMPPLGDLKISSNETNQVQIDSENRKPVPPSSLTEEVTVKVLGNKPEDPVNRKPVSASTSTHEDQSGSVGETKQTPFLVLRGIQRAIR